MKTRTKKKKTTKTTMNNNNNNDRISELPKEILVHILGFLEMDEFLIGTSLVSTQWRNLWKSVSTLNFIRRGIRRGIDDVDKDGGIITNNAADKKYHNFVDHVLRLRDSEASKVQIFRYYYCEDFNTRGGGNDGYLERLHNFIVSAVVNQGAQEIDITGIYLGDGRVIHLNPSIFTSRELRKITFKVYNHGFLIQLPRSICCATQLTHLTLCHIRLPEGNDDSNAAQLHLVFPILQTFHMTNCCSEHLKVLDISAPRLDTLRICNNRLGGFDFLGGCRIEIRTPNLTSLTYEGDVYVDCFTENLPRLADARLHFWKKHGMVEKTTSFAVKLLKGLPCVESLTMGGFDEVFSQDTLKVLLTPFTRLRTLELVTNCNRSSIHGMVHILNSCNSIEKLVWKVDELVEVEGDGHLILPQCILSHLKHVHIQRLRGHENEIEFVKFLLKSSVVLDEIIIQTTAYSPKQSIEKNLKQFIKEEPSLRRSIKLKIL